jgi:hypothetical protein
MKFFILIAPLLSVPLAFASPGGDYGYGYGEKTRTVTATVTHTVTKPIYKPPMTKTKTETVTKYKAKTETVIKNPYPTYHKPGYGNGEYKDSKEYKA